MNIPTCPLCTGRRPFCIHRSYPLPRPEEMEKKVRSLLSESLAGPSYSVFVGRAGYPTVGVGPMVGLQETGLAADSPARWFGQSYKDIIEARSLVVRSSRPENIFSRSRFIEENQLLALAQTPPETEIRFARRPSFHFSLSEALQPMGPSGEITTMKVTENPAIPRSIEQIVRDEVTAAQAACSLYAKHQDVYKITTILSSGVLGAEQRKKLVPTRWSITATDDLVALEMMTAIRDSPQMTGCLVFEATYMDNHFITLMMPGHWEFENFEAWAPKNWPERPATAATPVLRNAERIIQEYEPFDGRTAYAEAQAGGYYASRLAAVEYLHQQKRQAKVVTFREIGEHYTIPLGVWVVRETARAAVRQQPRRFSTEEEALACVKGRLRLPLEAYRQKSRILGRKTLRDFF